MNFAIAIFAGLMLAGCETLPTSTYTTAAGCGIAQWTKEFMQNNVSSLTWNGPCQNGLAHGKGTLTMKLNSGKQRVYSGVMEKGGISGEGSYTRETGWRYEGTFLWNLFIAGKIYLPSGRLLFDGLMAHNEEFQGKNLTFSDQRYKSGTIYFSESTYVTDGRYTGSAGPNLGLDGIDPKSGKGIIYGKYIQDNVTVYRMVEGKLYPDETSYLNAQTKYYEKVIAGQNAQIAAYNKEQEERKAKELREAIFMVSGALVAAAESRANAAAVPTAAPAERTAGRLSQQQIAACSEDIKRKQSESQSWSGDVNAVASRLGQYQKDLFEGRCAGHPEAQAYIAGANKMLGYGGKATGGGGTADGSQANVEIPAAPQCARYYIVSETPETRTSHKMFSFGIQNICSFPVYIHWNGYFNDVETQSIDYSIQLKRGTSNRPFFGPGDKVEAIPFRIATQRRFYVKIHSVCPTEAEATRLTGKRIASVDTANRGMCIAKIFDSARVRSAQ